MGGIGYSGIDIEHRNSGTEAMVIGRRTRLAAVSLFLALAFGIAAPGHAQGGRKHIYSETTDPRTDIAAGLAEAKREHKRVILDFGGDWCPDCQVLDIYFHQQPNEELLSKNFVLVHVFIGLMDKNLELAQQYGVPINRGVPALSVLDANGKVVHAQQTGEFNDMRHLESASLTEFLNRWKA